MRHHEKSMLDWDWLATCYDSHLLLLLWDGYLIHRHFFLSISAEWRMGALFIHCICYKLSLWECDYEQW